MGNDIVYITGITFFFIFLGTVLPFISEDQVVSANVNSLEDKVTDSSENLLGSTNAYKVIKSVILIFFWTFGAVYFWVDLLILLPIRIMFILLIARNIWIGGGS